MLASRYWKNTGWLLFFLRIKLAKGGVKEEDYWMIIIYKRDGGELK